MTSVRCPTELPGKYPSATITVSGPGGCINIEVQLIEEILKQQGFNVVVYNDHHEDPVKVQERIDSLRAEDHFKKTNSFIILKAEHQPWGG